MQILRTILIQDRLLLSTRGVSLPALEYQLRESRQRAFIELQGNHCFLSYFRKDFSMIKIFSGSNGKQIHETQRGVGATLAMVDQLAYTEENAERIAAVDNLFSATGQALARPGRVLVGEGRLLKLCRRRTQAKMFFLFDDILVYGSIVVEGRWCERQKVVPLENVVLEDLEDGPELKNRWLIRTPRKSFCVSAASAEEKVAWIEHIEDCRQRRLERSGEAPTAQLAATWVPDKASAICMRCSSKFSMTHRRHHCRQCGFVVCATCSRSRYVLQHISPKPVRVCHLCHQMLQMQDDAQSRNRGSSDGNDWSDDDELDQPVHGATGSTVCWDAHGPPSSIFHGVPLLPPKTKSR